MFWTIFITVPPLLVAVILHEIAHGLVAEQLGDPTARDAKRITLNPIRHIDPFLTIILPAVLILSGSGIVFGGAKPVPVNPLYFKNPRKGMLWVALAGPVTNFILALICYLALITVSAIEVKSWLWLVPYTIVVSWFAYGVLINLILGLFNLLPVPPLDGGRIAVGLLPESLAYKYARLERYGFLIVVALIYFGIPQMLLKPVIDYVVQFLA